MPKHLLSSRLELVGAHAAGIAGGLAVITLSYLTFYAQRPTDEVREQQLAYYAIAATDNLQVWRIGATKALDPDADVRLVYATDQVCGRVTPKAVASAEIRPVVHLAKGSFMRPGQLVLSAHNTTVSQLCDQTGASQYAFWSTDSKDLKTDLERLGQVPAYYAAGQ